MRTLPDKASELILLALEDLEKAEESPNYVVNMAVWHEPYEEGRCAVCLAGSVMAFSLDVDIEKDEVPRAIADRLKDPHINCKLQALNEFRTGFVKPGLALLKLEVPEEIEDVFIESYVHNPKKFKQDMRDLAAKFALNGL